MPQKIFFPLQLTQGILQTTNHLDMSKQLRKRKGKQKSEWERGKKNGERKQWKKVSERELRGEMKRTKTVAAVY